jgi:hypothetical protein
MTSDAKSPILRWDLIWSGPCSPERELVALCEEMYSYLISNIQVPCVKCKHERTIQGAIQPVTSRKLRRKIDELERVLNEAPAAHTQNAISNNAPFEPKCNRHNKPMVLCFYDRPGSPPGNGWSCDECAAERAAPASTPAEPLSALDLSQFGGHTPGPWTVADAEFKENGIVAYGIIMSRAEIVQANANLIAAAPALLVELTRLRQELRGREGA